MRFALLAKKSVKSSEFNNILTRLEFTHNNDHRAQYTTCREKRHTRLLPLPRENPGY